MALHGRRGKNLAVVVSLVLLTVVNGNHPRGPLFIKEPPGTVDFSNNTGTQIECTARGTPIPFIRWMMADGSPVTDVLRIRQVLTNGVLVFPPFKAEEYRQDVHAAVYKCTASNTVGSIVSRDVWVRAVVMQIYEVQVYDEFVITGNTGVLRCHIPSFVTDYVGVTSWFHDGMYGVSTASSSIENGPKFTILPSGELHIKEVTMNDGLTNFRCRTYHRLTKETRSSSTSGRLIVTAPQGSVPPRITDSRVSVQVKQGERTLLPCAAQGHPPPSYSWYVREKDGRISPVRESSRIKRVGGSLFIQNSQISDSAAYTCIVNNSIGSEKTETTLVVTALLSAQVEPVQQIVDLGRSAVLRCVSSGHPITSITWFHNGIPIDPFRIRTLSPEVLQIPAMRREDVGMYQCVIKNSVQCVHGVAEVLIGDAPPEFRKTFAAAVSQPGAAASLVCIATGNPQPSMTWTLDDAHIQENERVSKGESVSDKGEVVGSLNISHLVTEDGGEYECAAANSVGRISYSARLNVYGPPSIRPTGKISALAGGDTIVRCPFIGYPIDSISWEKDSLKLPVNRRQRVFPNGTLEIQNVQSELDAGKYTCVVQNTQGQTARRDLEIAVVVPPGIAPFSFQGEQFVEGMRTRATCYVSKGDLPISITWLKDGRPLSGLNGVGVRVIDEYSSILTIDNVSPAHSGNYTCVAKNAAAFANSTAKLVVSVPPRWLVEPKDSNVHIGQKIIVDCRAEGSPTPVITWMKAEGNMPGDYREIPSNNPRLIFASNGSLVLTEVTETDDGEYLCQAANGVGAGLSRVIRINVHVPPYFEKKSVNYTVKRGEDGHLICSARGDLPMKLQWFVNGNRLPRSQDSGYKFNIVERQTRYGLQSELIIHRVERHDNAVFTCFANNSFGSSETVLQLIVQQVPEPPKALKIVDVKSRSIQLTWLAPYNGNSEITKYKIQHKDISVSWDSAGTGTLVSGQDLMTTMVGLQPDHTYHLRMLSENSVGQSQYSDILTVTTEEEAPGESPRHVRVSSVDSQTLKITWMPPPKETWFGDILGYNVGFKLQNSTQPVMSRKYDAYNSYESTYQFLLSGLRKFATYEITVQAYNRNGNGPTSDPVQAMTKEDVPSEAPQNVLCTPVSSQGLKITWGKPSEDQINGILQGYKLIYKPLNNWYGSPPQQMKSTSETSINLFNLETYTNYSITVSALTRVGEGTKSESIICTTAEDVPDAPADIKAATSASDQIVISWKPPTKSKGKLVRYTVYIRALDGSKEETTKHSVAPTHITYIAKSLRKNRRHEFWVTASTSVGEGQSTRVVSQSPSGKVAAKITSFDNTVISRWKTNVTLHCRTVGHPHPEIEWFIRDQQLGNSERVKISSDGSLIIMEVLSSDVGNYTCKVRNSYGSDSIIYSLIVQAPPSPPTISVASYGLTSLLLQWEDVADVTTPILGYSLSFRREYGEWEELQLDADHLNYLLDNLWCGTRYQVYMTAYSSVGPGKPSDIINVKTKGSAPLAPSKEEVVQENITSLIVTLTGWSGDGCPILYFVLEYKPQTATDFILVSNHVKPQQKRYQISDLQPATEYTLRITAHNNAGSTVTVYDFITKMPPSSGANHPGLVETREVKGNPFYSDIKVVLPAVCSALVLITVVALLCLLTRRKRDILHRNERENAKTNPKYALVLERGLSNESKVQLNNSNLITEISEKTRKGTSSGLYPCPTSISDDVCPYATFQLAGFSRDHHDDGLNQTLRERKHSTTALRTNDKTIAYANVAKQRHQQSSRPEKIVSDERVPDLLYHSQESSSSNDNSPEMDDSAFQDQVDVSTYQRYPVLVKQRYPGALYREAERSPAFHGQDMPPPYYADSTPVDDSECHQDNYMKYIRELKLAMTEDASKMGGIIRRNSDLSPSEPLQTPSKAYLKDYTIAV